MPVDTTMWFILAAILAGAGTVWSAVTRAYPVALIGAGVLCLVLPRLFA